MQKASSIIQQMTEKMQEWSLDDKKEFSEADWAAMVKQLAAKKKELQEKVAEDATNDEDDDGANLDFFTRQQDLLSRRIRTLEHV